MQDKNGDINATYFDQHSVKYNNAQLAYACISITELQKYTQWQISGIIPCQPMIKTGCIFYFVSHFAALYSIAVGSAVATVEATEAAASVKILTGAIIISVIKITIVTVNANSTI